MKGKPYPSPEELERLFRLFLLGLDDMEVLTDMEGTAFPRRGIRFVRNRRKEFDIAMKVLAESVLDEARLSISTGQLAAHMQDIKAIATRLMDDVRLPTAFDIFHPSLPGVLRQGGLLRWEVTEDGNIDVTLPAEDSEGGDSLFQALLSHLNTGDLEQTVSDIDLWREQSRHYLAECRGLLEAVRHELESRMQAKLLRGDETSPGVTADFAAAACVALVEGPGVFRAPEYDPYQISDHLYGLRWCSITIAMAENESDLDRHEQMHRQMIEDFAQSQRIVELAELRADVDRLQRRVFGHLNRFCHTIPLPGYCGLCHPLPGSR